MNKGYWIPVLHSHLPFVKHPAYDYFLEEHWLFEAITECYIPLLKNLKNLEKQNIDFRLTVSLTPPLCEMLSDVNLMDKYIKHLDKLIKLGKKEIKRTKDNENESKLADYYHQLYIDTKDFFISELKKNVINGYRYFNDLGKIEVITCGATHGFLPLLSVNEKAVDVQLKVAVASHEKHFGKKPRGIWLAECAYYEGLEKKLKENGIEFFFLDSHALIYSNPTSKEGVYAPCYTPSGVGVFARDPESSKQVWSSKEGYPGDFCYRDFYRDIGYDLNHKYIKEFISPDGVRVFTGFKYHKITGESDYKELYDPYVAKEKTIGHAKDFHFKREKQMEYLSQFTQNEPMIVSPYDAELFGHWWFEGPEFLYNMFKSIDEYKVFKATTPSEYLSMYPKHQIVEPSPSSWGDKGYYDVWLNEGNSWIYRHLHEMADNMCDLAKSYEFSNDNVENRILNQMTRELLLAQSSDWAFLMTTGTAVEYSTKRTKEHISNFNRLMDILLNKTNDIEFLKTCEYKNSIFDFVDFRVFK